MKNQRFKITFSGELLEGYGLQEVHSGLAKFFHIDLVSAVQLFSGKNVVIESDLDHASALRCQARLHRVGAATQISPLTEEDRNGLETLMYLDEIQEFSRSDTASKSPVTDSQNTTGISCPRCRELQPDSELCLSRGICFRKPDQEDAGFVSNMQVKSGSSWPWYFLLLSTGVLMLELIAFR